MNNLNQLKRWEISRFSASLTTRGEGIKRIMFVVAVINLFAAFSTQAEYDEYEYQQAQYSEAELAQILAPIALYPDSLLSHVVIASTYPLEVIEAFRWREENSHISAEQAVELAQQKGWDPSVAALVAFPSVLERLNEDLAWTQNLGNAFLEDEQLVLDVIQDLRQQAEHVDTLKNLRNMKVTKVHRQIVIEPVQQEVIYVPYYDTRVVYGNWRWHRYPPVYWQRPAHYTSVSFGRGGLGFSTGFYWNRGIHISFDYFFSAFNWRSRHLVVTHHHKTRSYRSHRRIATSHVAKRWQHQPSHRRGVAYRSAKSYAKYGQHKQYVHGRQLAKRKDILHRGLEQRRYKDSDAKHKRWQQSKKFRQGYVKHAQHNYTAKNRFNKKQRNDSLSPPKFKHANQTRPTAIKNRTQNVYKPKPQKTRKLSKKVVRKQNKVALKQRVKTQKKVARKKRK